MVDSRTPSPDRLFDLSGRVAVVTGATGVLGGTMASGLARAGARVGVLGQRKERAEEVTAEVEDRGSEALGLLADVLEREQLEVARDAVLERWGRVDIVVNAAGGNVPEATVGEDATFFGLPEEPLREVLDLNLLGTVLPSQVFGEAMTGDQSSEAEGSIVNISSMAAQKPLTRVVGYSAAKAAVENLTRWLAVELARKYGPGLRVNAIAPGFFLGEQNRALLMHEDGSLTERGQAIVEHTPARRFGEPEELVGTLIWLCSPAARFVTGIVVPVDGGFGAFGGV
jgi:NAD(P)-dependent dehydrogenase (short-subunit alcohol dehydrogenase family)